MTRNGVSTSHGIHGHPGRGDHAERYGSKAPLSDTAAVGMGVPGDLAHLFSVGQIGKVAIKNRIVRAATSETLARPDGSVGEEYVEFYRRLARGGAGLLFTGHMYVEPRGGYQKRQAGLDRDDLVAGLQFLTAQVRADGACIFAELGHAGSQSKIAEHTPIAPSAVRNFISGRMPEAASEKDIENIIDAYGQAAARAKRGGFDGVHIHAGHGYLISTFSSPFSNHRTDTWGGSSEKRGRFLKEVYLSVRNAVGPDYPVSVKLGIADSMSGGLEVEEGVERAVMLEELGADAIEASVGIMHVSTNSNSGRFVAVSPRRAFQDLVVHRLFHPSVDEAYFRSHAVAVRRRLRQTPLMLVGGIRSTAVMESLIADGVVDFVSLARPLIREPDLPNQILNGRRGLGNCVSCNICAEYEGIHQTQCWRLSNTNLIKHAIFKMKKYLP